MQLSSPVAAPHPPPRGRVSRADTERLLVVMIPAYDEVENIEQVIRGIASLRPRLMERGLKLKVVVVDDGSTDGTAQAAQAAGADRVMTHRQNLGLGAAVRSGLHEAAAEGADVFLKIDADLQHNPEDILAIVAPIVAGDADLVYGERFSKISYKMPVIRRVGNIAFRGLMRWLTKWPIQDSQPGIFAVSGAYLEIYDIPGDYNYTQQILLDAYLKGMRFAHVSVNFDQRRAGKSFVSLLYPFKVLPQIILVIAMTKPMKIFGTCGVLFLLLGTTVFVVQLGQWMLGAAEKPVTNVNLVLGASLFGLQMLFFGILAKLVVLTRASRRPHQR
jgi:glycosyltransferase involved in cell wall biosynthesis